MRHQGSEGGGGGCVSAAAVIGRAVYNAGGERIGRLEDVVLTLAEGRAVYAVVSIGGFLGVGERHHALPWGALCYDAGRGGYVVAASREQLEGAPTFAPGEEPDWSDPGHGGAVARHYGFPPIV